MPQFCGMFVLRLFLCCAAFLQVSYLQAQPLQSGSWLFTLNRTGGLPVYVSVNLQNTHGQWQAVFRNDTETIEVPSILMRNDSLFFDMPVFESSFRLQMINGRKLVGVFTKGISTGYQEWQVEAKFGVTDRIPGSGLKAAYNISGKWSMSFQRPDSSWRPAIAEFVQTENRLTGTIINPSGDYRFLEGIVRGNNLYLTAFDGAHSYAFTATIANDSTIVGGLFFSGNPPGDAFKASKNAQATLEMPAALAELKPGQTTLSFRLPDLDSNMVSLTDDRFKGKVTIVQIMGSWCPNCMDETKFLSDYYNGQKMPQVEVVSLAYELSTDFARSAASLRKFKQRFNVRYPMLITGVKSADPDKAAKTLPQLTDIKYFPTTIFIDKQGRVRKVHNGFYGPGAPEYFEAFKKEFYATMKALLAE